MESNWVIKKGYSNTRSTFGYYAIHENCKYQRIETSEALGDYIFRGYYRPNSCGNCHALYPPEITIQIGLLNERI